jgi:hypothetical protein
MNAVPMDRLATVEAVRLLIRARGHLAQAIHLAGRDPSAGAGIDHVPYNEQYGLPYRSLWNHLRETSDLLDDQARRFIARPLEGNAE